MSSRLAPFLDRVSLVVAFSGVLLRWIVSGQTAGTGLNLFIHLLFWIGPAIWLLARALEGGLAYRFTGVEFALLAFAILCMVSALRAPYKLAALDHAFAYLSYGLLLLFVVNAAPRAHLVSLLLAAAGALAVYGVLQYAWLLPELERTGAAASREMEWRIRSREVFATFLYPNTFAGFLALLIPLAGGSLLDARGAAPVRAGILLACGTALVLTGSRGAWAALGAGAVAFAALAATRSRGRGAVAWGGMIALAAALVLVVPAASWLGKRSDSMRVRSVYYSAALKAWKSAPALGVGLDSFQDAYPRFKSEAPLEVRRVHHDYLQILAETGPLGLLALLALLGFCLRRALLPDPPAEAAPGPAPAWPVLAAAGAPLVGVLFFEAEVWILAALFVGAGCGAFLILRRGEEDAGTRPWTRIGAASGLVALLVHMGVDFDFYDLGVAMTLFLVLALVLTLGSRPDVVRIPRGACLGAAVVLLLVALPLLFFVPGAISAESSIEAAEELIRKYRKNPGETMALSDALRLSREAQDGHPFLPRGYQVHALAEFEFWNTLASQKETRLQDLQEKETIVLRAAENAIRLRPEAADLHAEKAAYHREFRRFYLGRRTAAPGDPATSPAIADQHLHAALDHQRRVLALYPTHAAHRYEMARLLDMQGDAPGAADRYRDALRLSDLAAREPQTAHRLQLEPLPKARCLRRLDRPYDAHDSLEAALRRGLQGVPPAQARAFLDEVRRDPTLLGGLPDEADDLMRPVISDAADAILKTLK